jgi:hypothetical protein
MNKAILTLLKTRLYLLDIIKDLSPEQLNKIPAGFNNNIIWHIGHMISSQQSMCYTRSGLPLVVDDKYYTPYRPGTKPDGLIDDKEIVKIKELIISTIEQLDKDYSSGIFINYETFQNRYGVDLPDVTAVLDFLSYHDGLHAGFITALKRAVAN